LVVVVLASMTCGISSSLAEETKKLQPLPEQEDIDPRKEKLGKFLFFDEKLSGDNSISCALCHDPNNSFIDGESMGWGYPGSLYFRNTPTIVNAHLSKYFYWDGRLSGSDIPTLIRDHISEAHFMNADGRLVIERLKQVPEYQQQFEEIFGGDPSYGRTLEVLEAFLKSLTSKNVPFDNYLKGEESALSDQAKAGLTLFKGKANCIQCHQGPMLSDDQFHNLGIPENKEIFKDPERHITFRRFFKVFGVSNYASLREDLGRYAVTKQDADRGKFLTPTLREVAKTAPYMHNGTLATLDDVIEFYDQGGGNRPNKSPMLKPLHLNEEEKQQLKAFLESLSGDDFNIEAPRIPGYQKRTLGKN
ncbi:photosynthetic protein synthase I, partial [PVC group bacterium]|nr:photosynthetic protein synthase I [PVC group bacterium]